MKKIVKRVLLFVVFIFILDVGISVYILRQDLKRRFPELDYSRTRWGISSWYSKTDKAINKHTANGEVFDDGSMTCAHWDYPFGQRLIVINPLTGKWVECRVNDRGPNKRLNREIDLTKAAFKKIANVRRGLVYVAVVPAGAFHTTRRPS